MMRALLYVQVSVSGQALVFVVRNQGYSLFQRAGSLTYAAFFMAQVRVLPPPDGSRSTDNPLCHGCERCPGLGLPSCDGAALFLLDEG